MLDALHCDDMVVLSACAIDMPAVVKARCQISKLSLNGKYCSTFAVI